MPHDPSIGNFEFPFTQDDFEHLRTLVTGKTGIQLPDGKKTMVYTRLVRRLRALNLSSFNAYIEHLSKEMKLGKDDELTHVINAITTNVTAFFRESHHFDHLTNELPRLVKDFGQVRIWCCASSTGEEPWTLAMVVKEFLRTTPAANVKIFASDLDHNVLRTAKEGVYSLNPDDVAANPLLKKYLIEQPGDAKLPMQKLYGVAPELKTLVQFGHLNLLENWSSLPFNKLHVVFCRNVIIYFSKETQKDIFGRLAPLMPTDSLLYIGHSESLLGVSDAYQNIGRTTHKKIEAA